MKRLIIALIGVSLFFAVLALHYVLPRVSVVDVVGVEVKRSDVGHGTRDVYMIQTQLIDGGAVRVFRNEDAWLYFKFDSATLQARVTALSREKGIEAVAIRHYGWRIPVMSMFPNAISAWPVEPDYRHQPLFNVAAIGLLLAGVSFAWRAVRRTRARVAAALARRAEGSAREAASRTALSAIDPRHEDWLLCDRPSRGRSDEPGRGT